MKPLKLTNGRYAWRLDDYLRYNYSVLSSVYYLLSGQIEKDSYISYLSEYDAQFDLTRAKRKFKKFLDLGY